MEKNVNSGMGNHKNNNLDASVNKKSNKKALIIIAVIAVVIVLAIICCAVIGIIVIGAVVAKKAESNVPVNESAIEVNTTMPETTEPETEVIKIDYEGIYYDKIKEYYDYVNNFTVYSDSTDKQGIWEIVNFAESNEAALSDIGYVIRDITGDDIPELVFCPSTDGYEGNNGTNIYALYTYSGNDIIFVAEGYPRNTYYVTENNTLFNYGSAGAAYSIFGEYKLSEKSGKLECLNFYFSDLNDEYTPVFYTNTTGEYDANKSDEISEKAFFNACDDLLDSTIKLDVTPLSEFKNKRNLNP